MVSPDRKRVGARVPKTTVAITTRAASMVMVGSAANQFLNRGRAVVVARETRSGGIAQPPSLLAFCRIRGSSYTHQNHCSGYHSKGIGRHTDQSEPILQYGEEEDAKNSSAHRPDAAGKARPAQHHRSEHIQLASN